MTNVTQQYTASSSLPDNLGLDSGEGGADGPGDPGPLQRVRERHPDLSHPVPL